MRYLTKALGGTCAQAAVGSEVMRMAHVLMYRVMCLYCDTVDVADVCATVGSLFHICDAIPVLTYM